MRNTVFKAILIDFLLTTLIGNVPPKAVLPRARQLNTSLPHWVDKYLIRLKGNFLWLKMFERLGEVHDNKLWATKRIVEGRRKHLKERLKAAQGREDEDAEKKILAIIQQGKDRSFWRQLNYAMGKHKQIEEFKWYTQKMNLVQIQWSTTPRQGSVFTIWKLIRGLGYYYLSVCMYVCMYVSIYLCPKVAV